jgi:hypothetical protein
METLGKCEFKWISGLRQVAAEFGVLQMQAAWRGYACRKEQYAQFSAEVIQGSVAFSLCTTAHPLHTNIHEHIQCLCF